MDMFKYTEGDLARFWSKVDKTNECWVWTSQRRSGYGLFRLGSNTVSAHRLSYHIANGDFDGFVLHHCDNPPCVRPDHLFVGTHQDNMDDMYAKGRRNRKQPYQKKEVRKARKISREQYDEILNELSNPYWGQVNDLATKYGVTHGMISQIKTGRFVPKSVSSHT